MLLSCILITHNRGADLEESLGSILNQDYEPFEILVVDNASTDDTPGRVERIRQKARCPFRYLRLAENLGVSGGRNVAIAQAQGEILITLDDDAVFRDPNAARLAVEFLRANPDVGILAFKLVRYDTGQIIRGQYPTRQKSRDPNMAFETTWFIGAGHAIRRDVFQRIGLYGDYAPYGSEEFDFSLRALDAGFRIWYFPSVEVRHKQSPQGRLTDRTKFRAIELKHRLKAAILNLPWPNVASYVVVWSAAFFLMYARFNLRVILLAYSALLREMPYLLEQRRPIGSSTLSRMRLLKGQLWY